MENQNPGTPNPEQVNQQFNQQFTQPFGQQQLPNSTAVLVLGIISIVFSVIWCYWIGSTVAVVLGIISLVLTKGCQKLYDENQSLYTQASYNNMKAGKVCAIIGLILGALALVTLLVIAILGATIFSSYFPR